MPDYDSGIVILTWPYTIPENGWILSNIQASNNVYNAQITYKTVNDTTVSMGHGQFSSGKYADSQVIFFPVEQGGQISRNNSQVTATFYPFKN